jgi:Flp pilus assembly protein TadG
MLGIVLMAMAVFRFQQVAYMAREGSRYASVHGYMYSQDTGKAAATADTIYTNAILPNSAGMKPSGITYSVTWTNDNHQYDTTTKVDATTGETQVVYVVNSVSVTVTYSWNTGLFGVIPVSSTSKVPMSY